MRSVSVKNKKKTKCKKKLPFQFSFSFETNFLQISKQRDLALRTKFQTIHLVTQIFMIVDVNFFKISA